MLRFIDGAKGSIVGNLNTTSDTIKVSAPLVNKLKMLKDGEHIYLTVKYLDRREIVKFTKDGDIRNNTITVERDQLGLGRKNFPCSACIEADWNSIQMHEYVCQVQRECR